VPVENVVTRTLDLVFIGSAVLAVFALPVLVVNWLLYMRAVRQRVSAASPTGSLPVKSIAFFITPILVALGVADVATTVARKEALTILGEWTEDLVVAVNDRTVSDNRELVSALRTVRPYWAHHSHPTSRVRVDVHGPRGHLVLELGRDSDNPREYWVFIPGGRITSSNEIGRITTSAFDQY
jgi:hypothetical protein